MELTAYKKWNTIIGWIVFGIAAFTYLSTIEHTVSLWDTGEFISCAYKLEVPHPPGAPMFILIYRVFTMLAIDPTWVPILTNGASGLASAFTILFLFWSVTALARKVLLPDVAAAPVLGDAIAIFGAGAVGALAYTWSDTFWFSAVEGEVYALSSMFTALVFWLALKWEVRAQQPDHIRWMVLIFYLIGVVIGIHLLGLLVIPVVVLMYYFRMYPHTTTRGILISLGIGLASLGVVQIGVIQKLLSISAWFDRLFVNSFRLPFWSGVIFFALAVLAGLAYGIYWSEKEKKPFFNFAFVSVALVIIGYTSYAMVGIRAQADTPINMYSNKDIYQMIGYVSREQYGDNYLVTGPYYTAFRQQDGYTLDDGAMRYRASLDGKSFEEAGRDKELNFNSKYTTLFPRMFNAAQENYIQGYKYWGKISNEEKITFGQNLRFFFAYQLRYMYWRYFGWNFIGRQNDFQGFFNQFHNGNWLSGISFIDESIGGLGPQHDLPYYMRNNAARNTLYGIPLILGILGLIIQYKKRSKDFIIVAFFFFMTGLAIALYLNMPAHQPRERDYAFVGSFYVFAIWIGLSVLFLYDLLSKKVSRQGAAAIATAICMVGPIVMVAQEWDDHDRSDRTAVLAYAQNYLESCAPNAILFTNGDNDTYPLWYAQEVEGFRDDVRIINLSLFSTDWYINQMRRPINNAPALPFSIQENETREWDYLRYVPELAARSGVNQNIPAEVSNVVRYVVNSNNWYKQGDQSIPILPTKNFKITVDKQAAIASGSVPSEFRPFIVDEMKFVLDKNLVYKSEMILLDIIAANKWKYPIYFSMTSGAQDYPYLTPFLQLEGLTYRLTPASIPAENNEPRVATDIMYDNLMNKFQWGRLDEVETFIDFQLMRQCRTQRQLFARLAQALLLEGRKDEALAAIEKSLIVLPERNVNYDFFAVQTYSAYSEAGGGEKATALGQRMVELFKEELNYYSLIDVSDRQAVGGEIQQSLYGLQVISDIATRDGATNLATEAKEALDLYRSRFGAMR